VDQDQEPDQKQINSHGQINSFAYASIFVGGALAAILLILLDTLCSANKPPICRATIDHRTPAILKRYALMQISTPISYCAQGSVSCFHPSEK
jgi:hypothetical protein